MIQHDRCVRGICEHRDYLETQPPNRYFDYVSMFANTPILPRICNGILKQVARALLPNLFFSPVAIKIRTHTQKLIKQV